MKKLLLALLCPLCVTTLLPAAQKASTFEDALKKAKADGIVAFCYGPDWNMRSVGMVGTFWKDKRTEKACGDAVMIAIPFYQRPTPSNLKEQNKVQGSFKRVRVNHDFRSFPAVCMMDRTGRVYAQLCGTDDLGTDEDDFAKGIENIAAKLDAFRRQTDLLAQAEKAQGVEKAKLLGQAATLGVYPPEGVAQTIKNLDPQDQSGYYRRLTYNAFHFNERANSFSGSDQDASKAMTPEQTEKELQTLLNNPVLSNEQKQESYAVYIGRLRKTKADKAVLMKQIKAMHDIDPDTMYGRIMPHLLELWCDVPDKSRTEVGDEGPRRRERSPRNHRERRERRRK